MQIILFSVVVSIAYTHTHNRSSPAADVYLTHWGKQGFRIGGIETGPSAGTPLPHYSQTACPAAERQGLMAFLLLLCLCFYRANIYKLAR